MSAGMSWGQIVRWGNLWERETERKCPGKTYGEGNVRIAMQDYKSLGVAVMICTTLVNTQTHKHQISHTPVCCYKLERSAV